MRGKARREVSLHMYSGVDTRKAIDNLLKGINAGERSLLINTAGRTSADFGDKVTKTAAGISVSVSGLNVGCLQSPNL